MFSSITLLTRASRCFTLRRRVLNIWACAALTLRAGSASSSTRVASEIAFSGVRRSCATKARYSSRRSRTSQRALGGEGLHRQPDRAVQHAVQDVEGPALQGEAVRLGEIVDAAAQDVVLGDDFLDVVSVLRRAAGRARAGSPRSAPRESSRRTCACSAAASSSMSCGTWSLSVGASRCCAEGSARTCWRHRESRPRRSRRMSAASWSRSLLGMGQA